MPTVQILNGVNLANQAIPGQMGIQSAGVPSPQNLDFGNVSPSEALQFQAQLQDNIIFSDAGDFLRAQNDELTPKKAVTNAIQKIQDQLSEIESHFSELTRKKEDLASEDLIVLQYDLLQLNYVCEMSTKTADKTSNGLQTLFRNQG